MKPTVHTIEDALAIFGLRSRNSFTIGIYDGIIYEFEHTGYGWLAKKWIEISNGHWHLSSTEMVSNDLLPTFLINYVS